MAEQLKGCPFCGKDARVSEVFGTVYIGCVNKKCKIQPSTWLRDQSNDFNKVFKDWNERLI